MVYVMCVGVWRVVCVCVVYMYLCVSVCVPVSLTDALDYT